MSSGFSKTGLYWQTQSPLKDDQPTVLFLHASWMSSSMWGEVAELLVTRLPGANLLMVDVHGHGKSIAGRSEYTLWNQAEDVLALLDELNLTNVLVAGISMGSMIALRMALLENHARVSSLILIGSNATAASEASKIAFYQLRDIWVATPTPSGEIMNAAILSWGGSPAPDLDGPRAKRVKRDWIERHSGPENIDPTLRSLMERDGILDRLGEIKVPVLMIHGEEDKTYPTQDARDIQSALANAKGEVRLEVVKGEGHLVVWMRDGEDVGEWIEGFAKKVFAWQGNKGNENYLYG